MSTERIPGWRFISDKEWRRNDGARLLRSEAGWAAHTRDGEEPTGNAGPDVEVAARHVDHGLFAHVGIPGVKEFPDKAGLPALIEAIRHLHGLEPTWVDSVPVVETHEGETVWAGEVQVFAVEHPKASRVYAWSHETDAGKRRFHAVLGQTPVTSAEAAVRVALLSQHNKAN